LYVDKIIIGARHGFLGRSETSGPSKEAPGGMW